MMIIKQIDRADNWNSLFLFKVLKFPYLIPHLPRASHTQFPLLLTPDQMHKRLIPVTQILTPRLLHSVSF